MKVVYIAGPYTGKTAWDIEQNVRQAEEVALKVAEMGGAPLCPHTNTRFFFGTCTEEFWYAATMALLKKCDAIVMVKGWKDSKGSKEEHAWAVDNELPIFYADGFETDATHPSLVMMERWLER